MTDVMTDVLGDLAYARAIFFRQNPSPDNARLFLANESLMLRILATAPLTITIPAPVSDFWSAITVSLTPEQINNALVDITVEDEDNCCICQESLRTMPASAIRNCNHRLHRNCATSWFTLSTRCPVCRGDCRLQNTPQT